MPLYEYEEICTGRRCELFRTVSHRDECPAGMRRVMAAPPVRMGRGGLPDPSDADQAAPRAIRELEENMGTTDFVRRVGWTPKQLRKIWNM